MVLDTLVEMNVLYVTRDAAYARFRPPNNSAAYNFCSTLVLTPSILDMPYPRRSVARRRVVLRAGHSVRAVRLAPWPPKCERRPCQVARHHGFRPLRARSISTRSASSSSSAHLSFLSSDVIIWPSDPPKNTRRYC